MFDVTYEYFFQFRDGPLNGPGVFQRKQWPTHSPFTNRPILFMFPPCQDRWPFSVTELLSYTVQNKIYILYIKRAALLRHFGMPPPIYLVYKQSVFE